MEAVRRRRLARGEPHAAVERILVEAGSLTGLMALALFDDAGRGAEVTKRLDREAGPPLAETFRRCEEGSELPASAALDLVRLASKLVAWLRGLG
jgi:hypothetical protein